MEELKIGDVVAVGEGREDVELVEIVAVIVTAEGTSYRVRARGRTRVREVAAGAVWRLVRPEAAA